VISGFLVPSKNCLEWKTNSVRVVCSEVSVTKLKEVVTQCMCRAVFRNLINCVTYLSVLTNTVTKNVDIVVMYL